MKAANQTTPDTVSPTGRPPAHGGPLGEIEALRAANAVDPDPAVECRLVELRHAAFDQIAADSAHGTWPVPPAGPPPDDAEPVPTIRREDLTADGLRRGIAARGSVLVPGLLDEAQVASFVTGIDLAIEVREANRDHPFRRVPPWFVGLPLPAASAQSLGRPWIAAGGGLLACDSPRLLEQLFSTYEALGLRDIIGEYLGERPILSANKCTMRRVPTTANADWHQDGAFLGTGIRALNVWIALSDCGTDSPGMDLLPRRFEEVQETGTGGAIFDWAVGPDVVARLSEDAPVVRPQFRAGDALLFDDLYLHRTAIEPGMTRPRYAIESWFFAATDYPEGQVPLVW